MRKRPKIIKRQKEVKLRKNFFVTLLITLLLWLGVVGVIYFLDPYRATNIIVFFAVVFFALFFTLSIIFISSRRGVTASCALIIFILLRYFGVGNIINFLLIAGIYITLEIYLSRK